MRSVVHEPLFAEILHDLIGDAEMADAYIAAAEAVLAETPEIGTPVEASDARTVPVWTVPLAPIGDRAVALYYTFDEETVWLVAIAAW